MPQLICHLLILILLFRHIKIHLQEWCTWYLIFVYASLYTLFIIFLYNIYFWFFLKLQPPIHLVITCRIIGFLTIIEIILISHLRIITEEDVVIWIISSEHSLQKRMASQKIINNIKPNYAINVYNYFNTQAETNYGNDNWIFWLIIRAYFWCLVITTFFGKLQLPEFMDIISIVVKFYYELDSQLFYYYLINFWAAYIFYQQIRIIGKKYNYQDLYFPGIIYRYKYYYEQNITILKSDIINRQRLYSPKRLLKNYPMLFQLTPTFYKTTQYCIDNQLIAYNYKKIIHLNYLLKYAYTRIPAINVKTPKITDFSTEQKAQPILNF